MPSLAEMLEVQYRQQVKIWGELPLDRNAQRIIAKEIAAALDEERVEYLKSIAYKSWLSREEQDRTSRIYELVDLLKCVLALFWTESVDPTELWRHFAAKTDVVSERLESKRARERFVAFDIDGVVCEGVDWMPDELSFVEAGKLLTLAPKQDTIEFMRMLRGAGLGILLVTSRKAWLYRQIEADTYVWLRQHKVPFDELLWGYDKFTAIRASTKAVTVAFEDKAKHAIDLMNGGISVVFMGQPGDAPTNRMLALPADHSLSSLTAAYQQLGERIDDEPF